MSIRKGNDIIASKPLIDAVPTQDSTNAVSSGGVYTALQGKQDTISDLATIRSGAAAGATAVQPSDLATVATTGSYNDLLNKPTIPTTLAALTGDVNITSPTNNQHLVYDGNDQKWKNTTSVALENTATGTNSLTVGGVASTYNQVTNIGLSSQAYSYNNVLVGYNTSAYKTSVAVGAGANAGDSSYQKQGNVSVGYAARTRGNYSIALGNGAKADANGAIQISATSVSANQTNSDANTFKVGNANGNFEMMSADGTIPEARLADTTSATQGQVLTLDSNLDAIWANPTAATAWGNITGTLSDQTDLDNALAGKVDVDASNFDATGKSTVAGLAMPSDVFDELTLGASGTIYTAPANGYLNWGANQTSSSGFIAVYRLVDNATSSWTTDATQQIVGTQFKIDPSQGTLLCFPIAKGKKFGIVYNNVSSTWRFRFVYAKGE